MNRRTALALAGLVALILVLVAALRGCRPSRAPETLPTQSETGTFTPEIVDVSTTPVASVAPTATRTAPPIAKPQPVASSTEKDFVAPKVKIFKELIPKDIAIVRVYYDQQISGPAARLPFDINGTGFTKEFERMISVRSGHPNVEVTELKLVTPNQIHGTLVIGAAATTQVAFPQVLIAGKVVFQAPEPFAVIRPGEVLNLIFTEMGESGRSGRFRVFTNLTPQMFERFRVEASTSMIEMGALSPSLPFVVDGSINIGGAPGGEYGIRTVLGDKVLWNRDGIIRVVRPNVGQSGLIQRTQARDGFHRPGDEAFFAVQGSGFRPEDIGFLRASVPDLPQITSTFTFVSPGRIELRVGLPEGTPVGKYGLRINSSTETLISTPDAFEVVPENWTRSVEVSPALVPGAASTLVLSGRDLTPDFVSALKVETDEKGLIVKDFTFVDRTRATASVSAADGVVPGDYLLRITHNGKKVSPHFGSLIDVRKTR